MSGPGWRAGRNSAGRVVHDDGADDFGDERRCGDLMGGLPLRWSTARVTAAIIIAPSYNEENEQEVRMSGVIDSSDTRGNPAEHHISAAFSDRAVRGILWGAELGVSKLSTKSATYSENWWSRGESNP